MVSTSCSSFMAISGFLRPRDVTLRNWISCLVSFKLIEAYAAELNSSRLLIENKVSAREFKSYKIDVVQEYDLKEVQRQGVLVGDEELVEPAMATLV